MNGFKIIQDHPSKTDNRMIKKNMFPDERIRKIGKGQVYDTPKEYILYQHQQKNKCTIWVQNFTVTFIRTPLQVTNNSFFSLSSFSHFATAFSRSLVTSSTLSSANLFAAYMVFNCLARSCRRWLSVSHAAVNISFGFPF